MFDKQQKLEISQQELAVIASALHTQSKILNVQASAGGRDARSRLNEVKRVLALVAEHRVIEAEPVRKQSAGWLGMSSIFG